MTGPEERSANLTIATWVPYVVPFVLFLLLTGPVRFFPQWSPFLYVTKTILVGILLWIWRQAYAEDFFRGLCFREVLTAVLCGLLVLALWVAPDGYLPQLGRNPGFDPFLLTGSRARATGLIAMRLLGAAVVVPVMEELFWRSFLMRYLINRDFCSVPMGTFTWSSYLAVAVLFGLEHHRIVEGVVAGLLYGLLVVRQKKLAGAILAHGITNLGLGIYVIATGSWMFW